VAHQEVARLQEAPHPLLEVTLPPHPLVRQEAPRHPVVPKDLQEEPHLQEAPLLLHRSLHQAVDHLDIIPDVRAAQEDQ